jgi:hypothetical protein
MNWPKAGKNTGQDEPIEDPQLLRNAMRQLLESETEFPIKVEGTSTLPYASTIQSLVPETNELILKLVRPLPHELLGGAVFRMVFAVDEQRYESLITFVQREAYLQYRFSQPEKLVFADRRRHKRFPFRPRENAYVIGSDGGIPGLGVAGPLVNICMGGLCLRVDRVLKLDDGIRIPVRTALFDRGSSFPRVRIQDLPRLPLIEVSGRVTHSSERGSEVLLGLDFGELSEDQARMIGDSLAFREKLFQSRSGAAHSESSGIGRTDTGSHTRDSVVPKEEDRVKERETSDPLFLLQRKTAWLVLVGQESALTKRCEQGLWNNGYHRLDIVRDVEAAKGLWEGSNKLKPKLVMMDLLLARVGDEEPLAAVRHLERQLASLGDVPTLILCEELDPTMLLGQSEGTRFLACKGDDSQWIESLDSLLEIGMGTD